MGLKFYLGSFGVTGVKRSYSPKMLQLLQITWHGHVIYLGSWGSLGTKGHFHKKCSYSSMLHRETIGLKYEHKFETFYLCYWVKGRPGIIWTHGVKWSQVNFWPNNIGKTSQRSKVKGRPGIIWTHRGQIPIFTKNAMSPICYVVYLCY